VPPGATPSRCCVFAFISLIYLLLNILEGTLGVFRSSQGSSSLRSFSDPEGTTTDVRKWRMGLGSDRVEQIAAGSRQHSRSWFRVLLGSMAIFFKTFTGFEMGYPL
jgi:hypothetical protein